MNIQTETTPTSTDNSLNEMSDTLYQAPQAEVSFDAAALRKLRSLSGWELEVDEDVLSYKKHYRFESADAAKEFVNSMGFFLKTNSVCVLVHPFVDRPSVILSMRANTSSEGALIIYEIADESERKYQMVTSCTQDVA